VSAASSELRAAKPHADKGRRKKKKKKPTEGGGRVLFLGVGGSEKCTFVFFAPWAP
jgi:hypothetical protein